MIPKDDRRTPQWFFNQCAARFGPFNVDVAANNENHLCDLYFTVNENALTQPWFIAQCDCVFEVSADVARDPGVLRAESGKDERTGLLVSGVRAGESTEQYGNQAQGGAGCRSGGESSVSADSARPRKETPGGANRESQAESATSPISVVVGPLAGVLDGVESPMRSLRVEWAFGPGPRYSPARPSLSWHCAVEHGSGVSQLQSQVDVGSSRPVCASCGVSGKPAIAFGNVPYGPSGVIPKWIAKARRERDIHGVRTLMLLPADTSTKWFKDVWQSELCELVPFRLAFGNGSRGHNESAKFGSLLAYIAPKLERKKPSAATDPAALP